VTCEHRYPVCGEEFSDAVNPEAPPAQRLAREARRAITVIPGGEVVRMRRNNEGADRRGQSSLTINLYRVREEVGPATVAQIQVGSRLKRKTVQHAFRDLAEADLIETIGNADLQRPMYMSTRTERAIGNKTPTDDGKRIKCNTFDPFIPGWSR
jgi:hypothetical protein